jgi:hypothetical protein
MAPPSEKSPYRLLVEGPDDHHSVIHLLKRHGFDWDDEAAVRPYISDENGVDKLLRALGSTLKSQLHTRIGVVLDANSDLSGRWTQIRDRAWKAIGLDLPASPDPSGTIIPGRQPGSRVGFWLMPDNESPGALEQFLGRLVRPEHPIWAYADEATTEARRRGAPCVEKDHAKSILYAWLAWQEEPGRPFGIALKSGLFDTDGEGALRFVAWFNRLFVED